MPRAKRIVVDASVARSAGHPESRSAGSRNCREALDAVGDRHRVVFSPAISDEWNRHQSNFARGWRSKMVARKRVDFLSVSEDLELRRGLRDVPEAKPREIDAMMDDAHLLEAALASDRIVLSRDESVRDLFRRAAATVLTLCRIHWGNPEIAEEGVPAWLRGGAKAEPRRTLSRDRRG